MSDWDVFSLANPRDRDGPEAGKEKLKATLEQGLGSAAVELFPNLEGDKVGDYLSNMLDVDVGAIDVAAINAWLQVRTFTCSTRYIVLDRVGCPG